MFIYLIYVGRVLPVHNQLLDGYTRPHLHSTRPKDGWTGPWMRQCLDVSTASKPSVSTVGSRQSTGDIERVQSAKKTTTVEEADIQTMHDTESVLSCPDKS